MPRGDVQLTIAQLMKSGRELSTREVAALAQVSRQAAHKQLRALVESGSLTVRGKARAARYRAVHRVDNLWAKVAALAEALTPAEPMPALQPQARLADPIPTPRMTAPQFALPERFATEDELTIPDPRPTAPMRAPQVDDTKRQRVEVASAGSVFRLSARQLLDGVDADELVLDFDGVVELGDDFLEEVFGRSARKNPRVAIGIVNLAPELVPQLQPYRHG
jgi:hypothetical protein